MIYNEVVFCEHPVHPALRTLVASIVGYDYQPDPGTIHHGLPSPTATVIISFDRPLDVGWFDDPGSAGKHWLLASGMHLRPAVIRAGGVQYGIQLGLTPTGCRALLGVPVGELAGVLTDHADLPLGITDQLHDQLAEEADWSTRFAMLEAHLLMRASDFPAGPADLTHSWALLSRSAGNASVDQLARTAGWSRRHLTTRFKAEFGLSPHAAARVHRFAAAIELAKTGAPLAQVAASTGYVDQPHLAREFRALAAMTASQWRTEEFPIIQDQRVG